MTRFKVGETYETKGGYKAKVIAYEPSVSNPIIAVIYGQSGNFLVFAKNDGTTNPSMYTLCPEPFKITKRLCLCRNQATGHYFVYILEDESKIPSDCIEVRDVVFNIPEIR